jgi:hypothetical protein
VSTRRGKPKLANGKHLERMDWTWLYLVNCYRYIKSVNLLLLSSVDRLTCGRSGDLSGPPRIAPSGDGGRGAFGRALNMSFLLGALLLL